MAFDKESTRQDILKGVWALVGPQDSDVVFVLSGSRPMKVPKFVVATERTVHMTKGSVWSSTKSKSILFSRPIDTVEIEYRGDGAFRFDEQVLPVTFYTDRDLGAAAELALTRAS